MYAKNRFWTDEQPIDAVLRAKSYRAALIELKLIPAGGNYDQVKRSIEEPKLATEHFTDKGWRVGRTIEYQPRQLLEEVMVEASYFQSYKLKNRFFREGLKKPLCELCGWCQKSLDGRLALELDHINGDKIDNRIENLRILCPNCHSLQPTHRGKNKKVKLSNQIK